MGLFSQDLASSGWRPTNQVERDMVAAFEAGDAQRYVRLLQSNLLYQPILVPGAEEAFPDRGAGHVVVFTSAVSLFWHLGGLAQSYEEVNLVSLRERFPDHRLVANPGIPISVMLSWWQLDEIAAGRRQLVSVDDAIDDAIDQILDQIRHACLTALGGTADAAASALDRTDSELELKLLDAVEHLDLDGFLGALIESDVVVLASRPVAGPRAIQRNDFSWLTVRHRDKIVIPAFSTFATLDRVTSIGPAWVRVPCVELIAHWPSDEHVLCFNPGTPAEVVLTGSQLRELRSERFGTGDG